MGDLLVRKGRPVVSTSARLMRRLLDSSIQEREEFAGRLTIEVVPELAALESMLIGFISPASRSPEELLSLVPEIRRQFAEVSTEMAELDDQMLAQVVRSHVADLGSVFDQMVKELRGN